MKKLLLILYLAFVFVPIRAYPEDTEINSQIISIDHEDQFFIIGSGESSGVEIGDGLIVHRDGEKIAEGYIIETRPDVAAVEILKLEYDQQILEGDSIIIVKRVSEEGKQIKLEAPRVSQLEIIQQADAAVLRINKNPETVFSYAYHILREDGYSIISSNRNAGILLAEKPIELSIIKELLADAFAAIDHNLIVSIEIKSEKGFSLVSATAFREHSQKEKKVKQPVTSYTRYYEDLVRLLSKIKERSEY